MILFRPLQIYERLFSNLEQVPPRDTKTYFHSFSHGNLLEITFPQALVSS